jgi:hypothetical protein
MNNLAALSIEKTWGGYNYTGFYTSYDYDEMQQSVISQMQQSVIWQMQQSVIWQIAKNISDERAVSIFNEE